PISRRALLDVWAVEPAREIAELRRLPDAAESLHPPSAPAPHRPAPPLAPRLGAIAASPLAADLHPVPPGYGFRRLTSQDLRALPSLRQSVLAIWEYPRTKGRRRYEIGRAHVGR